MTKASNSFTTSEADAYRKAMRRVLEICKETEDQLKQSGTAGSISGVLLVREAVSFELEDSAQ